MSVNSSANLCHKAYIQGFLENGCMVDLLTVGMNTSVDSLGFPKEARLKVYGYPMESLYEKLGKVLRKKGREMPLLRMLLLLLHKMAAQDCRIG